MSGVEREVSTLGNIEHWTLVGVERTIGQRRRVYVEVGTDGPALDAGEEVEVVRASTYQGAVSLVEALTEAAHGTSSSGGVYCKLCDGPAMPSWDDVEHSCPLRGQ